MTDEQLFRLQCTADVQKKLECFTMEENLRMAYEPVLIEAVAWVYALRVADYCSTLRVEKYKKTTRLLRELHSLYLSTQAKDLTTMIRQKILDGANEWAQLCARDLSIIWFSVNTALKQHGGLDHLDMRTDAYICLLIIRLYHREDDRIAETIARRLKQPKKEMPNPCIQSLVLLMRMYLENITPDYSRHEENALGILRNDLQYVNYNVTD
jgi:hypothetical protein